MSSLERAAGEPRHSNNTKSLRNPGRRIDLNQFGVVCIFERNAAALNDECGATSARERAAPLISVNAYASFQGR
jgi:hypothetical protein